MRWRTCDLRLCICSLRLGPRRAWRLRHAQTLTQVAKAGTTSGATGGTGLTLGLLADLADEAFRDGEDGDALRLHGHGAARAAGTPGTARFGNAYPAALLATLEAEAKPVVGSVCDPGTALGKK